jgi:hypothetical protein
VRRLLRRRQRRARGSPRFFPRPELSLAPTTELVLPGGLLLDPGSLTSVMGTAAVVLVVVVVVAMAAIATGKGKGKETSSVLFSLFPHMHLTWTCLVLRSSRQCSHWVIGRPFFLTSNRGRSLCLHADERCPLMQDSLQRNSVSKRLAHHSIWDCVYHAYFLSPSTI